MHKRRSHRLLVRLRGVRYAYFAALFVVATTVFVFAYRNNNLTAIHLRDQLIQADKDNGDVQAALNTLREFTYSHMNTNLSGGQNSIYPPIQLKYTYERLVQAEKARVDAANSKLYTNAQTYCEQQVTSRVTINRVPCIQSYLASHGAVSAQPIPDGLYKFDFVAPVWSPDLAGWSMIVAFLALVALITRIVLETWLRHRLRD